jgi:hypothetical protein
MKNNYLDKIGIEMFFHQNKNQLFVSKEFLLHKFLQIKYNYLNMLNMQFD